LNVQVSDDIVTRLRHVAWLAEEGSEVTDLAATAADEIERLRAVIASFPCQCLPNGIVCHRCKEADRG
jgi:hypothetical protein